MNTSGTYDTDTHEITVNLQALYEYSIVESIQTKYQLEDYMIKRIVGNINHEVLHHVFHINDIDNCAIEHVGIMKVRKYLFPEIKKLSEGVSWR